MGDAMTYQHELSRLLLKIEEVRSVLNQMDALVENLENRMWNALEESERFRRKRTP